jgi:hypothetical protein
VPDELSSVSNGMLIAEDIRHYEIQMSQGLMRIMGFFVWAAQQGETVSTSWKIEISNNIICCK